MLGRLLGSINKERVLVYLVARERGYAREIARFFAAPLDPIQKALNSLEAAAVLVSRPFANARVYEFNPRYATRRELSNLIRRTIELYPEELRERLLFNRARPRRKGKPL